MGDAAADIVDIKGTIKNTDTTVTAVTVDDDLNVKGR